MSQDHVLAHIRANLVKCECDADVTHCTAPQRHAIVCTECISAVALRVASTLMWFRHSDTHVVLHVVVRLAQLSARLA
jgi:hypothetical protein